MGVLVGLTLITAGAMGNIIDCFFYGLIWPDITMPGAPFSFLFGRVVDMFYFPLVEWYWPDWFPWVGGEHFIFFSPIFNFADACISCAVIAILLFYNKCMNWGLDGPNCAGDGDRAEK
jgi:signal peptidase II